MSGLSAAAAAICGCCVIVALLSRFVTDGGTKKLVWLAMGAFLICAVSAPLAQAVGGISAEWQTQGASAANDATADEALEREVLFQTKQNLEKALTDILAQNGFEVSKAEVILALADDTRVMISSVKLTVSEQYAQRQEEIVRLVEHHFTVRPQLIME